MLLFFCSIKNFEQLHLWVYSNSHDVSSEAFLVLHGWVKVWGWSALSQRLHWGGRRLAALSRPLTSVMRDSSLQAWESGERRWGVRRERRSHPNCTSIACSQHNRYIKIISWEICDTKSILYMDYACCICGRGFMFINNFDWMINRTCLIYTRLYVLTWLQSHTL